MSKGNGQGTVLKRCACAPKGATDRAKLTAWRKCQHTWSVRYYAGGKLHWESFKDETAAQVRQTEIMRSKLTGRIAQPWTAGVPRCRSCSGPNSGSRDQAVTTGHGSTRGQRCASLPRP